MLRAARLAVLLAAAGIPAFAGSVVFQGVFNEDDDVALLPFSITATDLVTIESYGYAGGTAPGGIIAPEGGFAPNAILFDSSGTEITSNQGGDCAITGADSVTGNCDDPYFQETLAAGSYTLALVEWDNTTTDGFLPNGFNQTGNPGFIRGQRIILRCHHG